MKKYLEGYMKGLSIGMGILTILGITGVAYGAYVSMTDVNNGETLTASTFNILQENIRTLKTTVDGHTTTLGGLSNVPSGAVMAFNLSSCPSGWIAANGANGTPDLRGEFIRGLDGGRGVDSGRTIGTYQAPTKISSPLFYGDFGGGTNFAGLGFSSTDSFTQVNYGGSVVTTLGSGAGWTGLNSAAGGDFTTRPRNVALLYCVKQ